MSLAVVIRGALGVEIQGSIALFLGCAALHLFATTSMGIFMATVARSMPQFGLLLMLTMIPLEMLSGAVTPRESMPDAVRWLMSLAPTTHFVGLSQAILFRGAGLATAIVSSSANTRDVLRSIKAEQLFDVRVDGVVAAERGLPGKPHPDTLLAAARDLGVEPSRAAVFEDALAGMDAGRSGHFGYVVGVDRVGQTDALYAHGADRVVKDLAELGGAA